MRSSHAIFPRKTDLAVIKKEKERKQKKKGKEKGEKRRETIDSIRMYVLIAGTHTYVYILYLFNSKRKYTQVSIYGNFVAACIAILFRPPDKGKKKQHDVR